MRNCNVVFYNGTKDRIFEQKIKKHNPKIEFVYYKYEATNINEFKNKKLIALAGIGNPDNFFNFLEDYKLNIIKKLRYPDHYRFSKKNLDNLLQLKIKYNASIGYAYNFNEKKFNNIVFNMGYDRVRFENNINSTKNILYSLIMNLKFNKLWLSISSSVIDGKDNNMNQYAINFLRSISANFILSLGYKLDYNENNQFLETSYILIRYKL